MGLTSDRGYALPTVLLISLMITLITMAIVDSVHQKARVVEELQERTEANLKSYSAMNEVIYGLLTSLPMETELRVHREDGSTALWNLYGEPIELAAGVSARLRDCNGLAVVPFSPVKVGRLVAAATGDSSRANTAADALADWEDEDDLKRLNGAESFEYTAAGFTYSPRNHQIQTLQELLLVKGFDEELFAQISDDLASWGATETNYLTMSERMLRAMLADEDLVQRLLEFRAKRQLNYWTFTQLTGIQRSEQTVFGPSGWIKVAITAKQGKAVDTIEALIGRTATDRSPFMVAEWKH
jgi:general secretion pathway protein K